MERLIRKGQLQTASAAQTGPSRLGIGFEKLDRRAFEPEKAYDLVADLGVHYVRIQSGWQRTETARGVYDFAWLDAIVDELVARGMEPWIDLVYGNGLYTPSANVYYGAVGCPPIFSEEERRAWRDYVAAVVSRYKGRVRWYEVWNEPDGQHCWKHGVNAAEYGDFAAETSRAIHAADPGAKAIVGVLCSVNLPYFRAMFERGAAEAADAVSFHRYNANELEALNEIRALRALVNEYNPNLRIIQGESGTQSSPRGAGALRGGAWTPLKQAKYLLRHRLLDLASEVEFTSHFTALDMVEALGGMVGDKQSYLDFGYFGVISADFNEDGLATGTYSPKPAYRAMQNLCALFRRDAVPGDLPIRRVVLDSPRFFGKDEAGNRFISLGFRDSRGTALAYWNAADLLRETYEGTVSFQLAGVNEPPVLIDLMDGIVYALPDAMLERSEGVITGLRNLPLMDSPLLLAFGGFGGAGVQE